MIQKEIYKQKITREIDGVIKANDDRHLKTELEEYVLTDELLGKSTKNRMLPGLFEELASATFSKCIWISGYFGSGKSHLLKMLSLVLSNKPLSDGTQCAKTFASKASADFELENNILRAAAIPTETILFNIQAKSDGIQSVNSKIDPVLAVFLKVFNEHLGYDSLSPEIANIERHLEEIGKLSFLKEQFPIRYDQQWSEAREAFFMNQHFFEELFAEIKGIPMESATQYVNNAVNNYNLDIDTFTDIVAKYLETKPKQSRLIFCVDEVGQYIAEDVTRMLSLQTIAEVLSSKTNGKALLIVTSQNDLDATVGNFNATQRHDFSRIQGRFALKIPLTSANADEVIQKRLLIKKDFANELLATLYEREKNTLKTLLRFEGDTVFNIPYKDVEHFQNTFPFIPYQFDLLQQSIRELSKNNAFVGGHQSVGERSMLSIFQQVAKKYMDKDLTNIVSFGSLYDGLTDILQSRITADITQVSKSLGAGLTVEVLQALFLLKYVKGLTTNVANLTTLLLPAFDTDLVAFRRKVQEALNQLENMTYIRRTAGDVYEYLTNQEKDIENEIKNTEIEPGRPQKFLNDLLFNEIYSVSKIQLPGNRYLNYDYGKKCDGATFGRDNEIYLHFITPLCQDDILRSNPVNASMANQSDLIVYLRDDSRLRSTLLTYLQTERYTNTTHTQAGDVMKIAIRNEKMVQNQQRKQHLIQSLQEAVSEAKLFLAANELTEITQTNVKEKLTAGIIRLLQTVYTNVGMIKAEFTEESIIRTIRRKDDIALETDLSEAELEVFNRIQRNKLNHERTTVKSLIDVFSARPYGWYANATNALVASLCKRGKISLKRDSALLSDDAMIEALTKTNQYPLTIVEIEDVIQQSQVNALKRFYQDYFGEPCTASDAREVSKAFAERLKKETEKLEKLLLKKHDFKFLSALEAPINRIKELSRKTHPYFYQELKNFENDLLDDKEDLIEPIENFIKGPQAEIYQKISKLLQSNSANLSYVTGESLATLRSVLQNSAPYKGSVMQEAKIALEELYKEITGLQLSERQRAIESVEKLKLKIAAFDDYAQLTGQQQDAIQADFNKVIHEISENQFIANIRQKATEAEERLYDSWINRIAVIARAANPAEQEQDTDAPTAVQPKRITYVRKDSVKVAFAKPSLETEADVDAYIAQLRAEFMRIIKEEKKISL